MLRMHEQIQAKPHNLSKYCAATLSYAVCSWECSLATWVEM